MLNKVLIITYYWPPSGGAGVQRWLKFAKYLPENGWEPVILTVDPSYATYPALDLSLKNELPASTKIYRTRATDWFRLYRSDKSNIPSAGFATDVTEGVSQKIFRFIRGNFFIPDPRRGWNSYSFREACRIIEEEDIKSIITTSPPHSTQLTGLKLKKKFPEIKWIADLRDPWTDIYYYDQFYHTSIAMAIDRKYEKLVLSSADRIITIGRTLKELFSSKIPGIENKIEVITNGFDQDDFTRPESASNERFLISYIGTISDSYPVQGLLVAATELINEGMDLKLRFVGNVSPDQKKLIVSTLNEGDLEFISYVNHSSAVKYMNETSVLLLIIPDHKSNKSIITGKIFEYLAAGKPILCLGPEDGDAAEILRTSSRGTAIMYSDSVNIKKFLKKVLTEKQVIDNRLISAYSRRSLTQHLAIALNE